MSTNDATDAPTWKASLEFPDDYEVSSEGEIRRSSVYRNRCNKPRLKAGLLNSGYLAVKLTIRRHLFHRLVHRMVAEAHIGPIPPKYEVNHKNGDKLDNRADNLEIVSCRDNHLHAVETGLAPIRGEGNPQAKVTAEIVRSMRADYRTGAFSHRTVATKYGVSEGLARRAINRSTWNWLDDE